MGAELDVAVHYASANGRATSAARSCNFIAIGPIGSRGISFAWRRSRRHRCRRVPRRGASCRPYTGRFVGQAERQKVRLPDEVVLTPMWTRLHRFPNDAIAATDQFGATSQCRSPQSCPATTGICLAGIATARSSLSVDTTLGFLAPVVQQICTGRNGRTVRWSPTATDRARCAKPSRGTVPSLTSSPAVDQARRGAPVPLESSTKSPGWIARA